MLVVILNPHGVLTILCHRKFAFITHLGHQATYTSSVRRYKVDKDVRDIWSFSTISSEVGHLPIAGGQTKLVCDRISQWMSEEVSD